MKIDYSVVLMVLFFVLPGYCAYWTKHRLTPRNFSPIGTTEELASFVSVSAFVHGFFVLFSACFLSVLGICLREGPGHFFVLLDSVAISAWLNAHRTETAAGLAAYLATSCLTGLLTGIFLAVHTLNRDKGILRFLFRGRLGAWFAQHEVRGVVSDEPMIFSALRPEMGENGRTKAVWVEAELRDAHGIYTGLVASYSMGRDDSAHKLLLLENVLYIPTRESEYEPVPNQSVLLDMADVLVLRIEQRPRKLDSPALKPPQMPHNFEDSETSTIEEA